MVKAIPTLSSAGWVKSLAEKADYALAYCFLTDNLQSNIYRGRLTSFQAIIQNHIDDLTKLQLELRDALDSYFNRIFDTAFVEISVKDFPIENGTRVMLTIDATVVEGDEEFHLSRLASFVNGKFEQVNRANSFGVYDE